MSPHGNRAQVDLDQRIAPRRLAREGYHEKAAQLFGKVIREVLAADDHCQHRRRHADHQRSALQTGATSSWPETISLTAIGFPASFRSVRASIVCIFCTNITNTSKKNQSSDMPDGKIFRNYSQQARSGSGPGVTVPNLANNGSSTAVTSNDVTFGVHEELGAGGLPWLPPRRGMDACSHKRSWRRPTRLPMVHQTLTTTGESPRDATAR